jgi:hypothetical protein
MARGHAAISARKCARRQRRDWSLASAPSCDRGCGWRNRRRPSRRAPADGALDADLAAQAFQWNSMAARVGQQFAALAAVGVGVEHETAQRPQQIGPVVLHQHHAQRGRGIGRGGGHGHGFGVVDLALLGLGEPGVEQGEGIGCADGVGFVAHGAG